MGNPLRVLTAGPLFDLRSYLMMYPLIEAAAYSKDYMGAWAMMGAGIGAGLAIIGAGLGIGRGIAIERFQAPYLRHARSTRDRVSR